MEEHNIFIKNIIEINIAVNVTDSVLHLNFLVCVKFFMLLANFCPIFIILPQFQRFFSSVWTVKNTKMTIILIKYKISDIFKMPDIRLLYFGIMAKLPIKLLSQSKGTYCDIASIKTNIKNIAKELKADIIWLSVLDDTNIPIEIRAAPKRVVPNKQPTIKLIEILANRQITIT